jgi:hypothetical protein
MFTPFANQNQFDPDAGAFINASGIGGIEAVAVNNLVNQLKTAGLWGKFNAIYPIVGGTATSHKWNLINPQDTNAAYRLTYGGTVTHTADGLAGNGTNGFALTYLAPNVAGGGTNDIHVSIYCNNIPSAVGGTDIGCTNNSNSSLGLNVRNPSNLYNTAVNNFNFGGTANTTPGFFNLVRSTSTAYRRYKNTTETTVTVNSNPAPTVGIIFCAWNSNGTPGNFVNRRYAWVSIGYSLTAAENAILYNIVQQFEITLGRAVV